MTITPEIIKFLHKWEGLRLQSYKCPAGVYTIGYGNTYYETGAKVKPGETITKERANQLFLFILNKKADELRSLLKPTVLTPNQFSALLSFYYNIGPGSNTKSGLFKLKNQNRPSTLWLMLKENPNNPNIANEIKKWINPGSPFEKGLHNRRTAEAEIYFS